MLEKILYILLAVAILLLMIVIHELGHYIAGKILKFKINEFSVGFGPKLLQKKRKNGELVTLRAVPLGGYCAFEGEEDVETPTQDAKKTEVFENVQGNGESGAAVITRENTVAVPQTKSLTFNEQAPWKRIIVFFAGAFFNLISAVVFTFFFLLIIGFATPRVATVFDNNGIPYNNLIAGDEIVMVDGKKIDVMNTFEELIAGKKLNESVTLTIIRSGKEIEVIVAKKEITTSDENYVGFGIQSERIYHNGNFGSAIVNCVPYTFKLSWMILGTFGKLITGQIPITQLAGPIGTIDQISSLSMDNWRNILVLLPLIASNLAVFNLLPIPALDGSKIVFAFIEWIRRKPINRKVENIIHLVGLFALFGFVILVDIIGMFV